jgi:hypothetical protein
VSAPALSPTRLLGTFKELRENPILPQPIAKPYQRVFGNWGKKGSDLRSMGRDIRLDPGLPDAEVSILDASVRCTSCGEEKQLAQLAAATRDEGKSELERR